MIHNVVKGTKTVESNNVNNQEDKKLNFKNNAPFRSCISKINNTLKNSAEDLDIVMPMYNLLEYSDNRSMTSGSFKLSLFNYCRNEVNDNANENNADNYRINNKTITGKSFEYKKKLIWSTPNDNNTLNIDIVVPLKYLSNFWRFLDLPLITCETELDLSWSK